MKSLPGEKKRSKGIGVGIDSIEVTATETAWNRLEAAGLSVLGFNTTGCYDLCNWVTGLLLGFWIFLKLNSSRSTGCSG